MRRVRVLFCMTLLATLTNPPYGQAQGLSGIAKNFVGMWQLVSWVDAKGQFIPTRGAHPTGFIVYDASGNMSVQIMADLQLRRKYTAAQPTPDEAKAALMGYTAYFGTWEVGEKAGTIIHHRKGDLNPGGTGVDYVRKYEFGPVNRVTLILPGPTPASFEGQRLTWERVK